MIYILFCLINFVVFSAFDIDLQINSHTPIVGVELFYLIAHRSNCLSEFNVLTNVEVEGRNYSFTNTFNVLTTVEVEGRNYSLTNTFNELTNVEVEGRNYSLINTFNWTM
jgi:hypothetical protein